MQQNPAEQGANQFISGINKSGALIKDAYKNGFGDGAAFAIQDQITKIKLVAEAVECNEDVKAGILDVVLYLESLLIGEKIHDLGGIRENTKGSD